MKSAAIVREAGERGERGRERHARRNTGTQGAHESAPIAVIEDANEILNGRPQHLDVRVAKLAWQQRAHKESRAATAHTHERHTHSASRVSKVREEGCKDWAEKARRGGTRNTQGKPGTIAARSEAGGANELPVPPTAGPA